MSNQENPAWQYSPGQAPGAAQTPAAGSSAPSNQATSFSWTAAEFIEHQQSASWYAMMGLFLVIITATIYFVTKDYFAVGATIVAGLIAIIFAHHKPKQVTYELTSRSLSIGQKKYAYGLFKSFSILREDQLSSINLMPIKRLMPPVTAYFQPQDEQKIVSLVGEHLPYEEHKFDIAERITRSLHL